MLLQSLIGTEKELSNLMSNLVLRRDDGDKSVLYDRVYLLYTSKIESLMKIDELSDDIEFEYLTNDSVWNLLVRRFVPLEGHANSIFGELLRAIHYLINWYNSGPNYSINPSLISSWKYIIKSYCLYITSMDMVLGIRSNKKYPDMSYISKLRNDLIQYLSDGYKMDQYLDSVKIDQEPGYKLLLSMKSSIVNMHDTIYDYLYNDGNIYRLSYHINELNRDPGFYSR